MSIVPGAVPGSVPVSVSASNSKKLPKNVSFKTPTPNPNLTSSQNLSQNSNLTSSQNQHLNQNTKTLSPNSFQPSSQPSISNSSQNPNSFQPPSQPSISSHTPFLNSSQPSIQKPVVSIFNLCTHLFYAYMMCLVIYFFFLGINMSRSGYWPENECIKYLMYLCPYNKSFYFNLVGGTIILFVGILMFSVFCGIIKTKTNLVMLHLMRSITTTFFVLLTIVTYGLYGAIYKSKITKRQFNDIYGVLSPHDDTIVFLLMIILSIVSFFVVILE
jgi:hypothetical protein